MNVFCNLFLTFVLSALAPLWVTKMKIPNVFNKDIKRTCRKCNSKEFVFTVKEQKIYAAQSLQFVPSLCKEHRALARLNKTNEDPSRRYDNRSTITSRKPFFMSPNYRKIPRELGVLASVSPDITRIIVGEDETFDYVTTNKMKQLRPGTQVILVISTDRKRIVSVSLLDEISLDQDQLDKMPLPVLKGYVQGSNSSSNYIEVKTPFSQVLRVTVPEDTPRPQILSWILFKPVFDAGLITGGVMSSLFVDSTYRKPHHEVLDPTSATMLGKLLNATADLTCPPALSPFPCAYDSLYGNRSNDMAGNYANLEYQMIVNLDRTRLAPEGRDELTELAATGLNPMLILNHHTVKLMKPRLHKWLMQVNNLCLNRSFHLLYPISSQLEEPSLSRVINNMDTKLASTEEFPELTQIRLLKNPIKLLSVDADGIPCGTAVFKQFVVLTYQVSRSNPKLSLSTIANPLHPDIKPVGEEPQQDFEMLDDNQFPNNNSGDHQGVSLQILVPKDDVRAKTLATPTQGLSICRVPHSMNKTHLSLILRGEQPCGQLFEHMLKWNSTDENPLLMAPLPRMVDGKSVITIFLKRAVGDDLSLDELYSKLKANYIMALTPHQIRLETELDWDELIKTTTDDEAMKAAISVISNDEGSSHRTETPPPIKCLLPRDEKNNSAEATITLSNIPITTPDSKIRYQFKQLFGVPGLETPDNNSFSIYNNGDTLVAQVTTANQEALIKARKFGGFVKVGRRHLWSLCITKPLLTKKSADVNLQPPENLLNIFNADLNPPGGDDWKMVDRNKRKRPSNEGTPAAVKRTGQANVSRDSICLSCYQKERTQPDPTCDQCVTAGPSISIQQ